ncbi:trypsin-like peptidase domain-containing protein [Rhodovulum bhavnagarense]|nr:trypsin-like peptidase domain-containing protein [Rhodovulum bhavnagarense]
MKRLFFILFLTLAAALPVHAQDRSWVQIEAQPDLQTAQERASAYSGAFPDIAAFRMSTGWYALALGPYAPEQAAAELRRLRAERLIPRDSFVADGAGFEGQVWPAAGARPAPATPPAAPATPAADPAIPALDTNPPPPPEETLAQARRSERELDRDQREQIQIALKWEGFYDSGIDAAFGPGTRRAMADWQAARGYDPTGVLTTRQRDRLLGDYQAQIARLGMQPIEEIEAGIRIDMPLGLVQFDRYEPPFVHFAPRDNSGVQALLISQRGDQGTLYGLYDIMQTLKIVPVEGERNRTPRDFTLTGQNARLHSYTYAMLTGGMVKGFSLVWQPGEEKLMQRAIAMMRESLDSVPNVALDETLGVATQEQRTGMLSGLEIRTPESTHTGFFIDAAGMVLTTIEGLSSCDRITVGPDLDATLGATEPGLGLALLKPSATLAPIAHAAFQVALPRLGSDIAVSGFSYGEALDLPVLTYGKLADLRGLGGEQDVQRLEIEVLEGDSGGPVLDQTGAVLGILLPPPGGDRHLPDSVRYAADVEAISAFLTANGINPSAANGAGAMPPARLSRHAADMTVPVSCWK